MVRTMPAAGLDTRWPFISVHSWGTQVIEPRAQFILRPNETQIGEFPNEDAQSLVFDDSTLFAVDKFSGYDRVEGGSRLNAGVEYTANIHSFGLINALFGQSYQFAGRNSFAYADTLNTGLESGLEDRVSDYVGRFYMQPSRRFSFTARARFDKDDWAVRRLEVQGTTNWERLTLATTYAQYEAQPLVGYLEQRHGVLESGSFRLTDNWTLNAASRYDFTNERLDYYSLGLGYVDECFTMAAAYVTDLSQISSQRAVHKFVFKVNLRTMGGNGFQKTNIGSATSADVE
jgi:LPS-assembly protein